MKLKNRQKNRKLAMIFLGVIIGIGIVIIFLLNYRPSPSYKSEEDNTVYDFSKFPLPMIINENDIFE